MKRKENSNVKICNIRRIRKNNIHFPSFPQLQTTEHTVHCKIIDFSQIICGKKSKKNKESYICVHTIRFVLRWRCEEETKATKTNKTTTTTLMMIIIIRKNVKKCI